MYRQASRQGDSKATRNEVIKHKGMELEDIKKELDAIKVEKLSLKSLRRFEEQATIYKENLRRSEVELANYRIEGACPWMVISSEVSDTQRELCDEIRAQAKLYGDFGERVSAEITRRLETLMDREIH